MPPPTCVKRRYRTQLDAKIALASASVKHDGEHKTERRVYRCPRCRGWHLTSQEA